MKYFVLLMCLLVSCSKKDNSSSSSASSGSSSSAITTQYADLNLTQGKSVSVGALNLVMQNDGNLVLYSGSTALWYTGTSGQNCSANKCFVAFQGDGNLVVYNRSTAIWDSRTGGNAGAKFILSDQKPYLKVVASDDTVLWESLSTYTGFNLTAGQSLSSEFSKLIFQGDGSLVLYRNSDGAVLWSSKTTGRSCSSNCSATIQASGDFTLVQNGIAYWSAHTSGFTGNNIVLSRRPPYISVRTTAGKTLWSGSQNLYWLTPLEPSNGFKGALDFMDLFTNPAGWVTALTKINVFKIYSWYFDTGKEEDLRVILRFLKKHNIALAIEYGAVTPPAASANCGAVEGYISGSTPAALAQKVAAYGGDLAYVALDEPINGAHYPLNYGAPPAVGCQSSINEVAANVASSYLQMQTVFPGVQFGDIENMVAFPATANWIGEYGNFIDAFKYATGGSPLAFFHDDGLYASGVWQSRATAFLAMLDQKNVSYGVIHDGVGATTPQEWMTNAQARMQTYHAYGYVNPEQHIFQTWDAGMPTNNLPDTTPGTLTNLVNYFFSSYAIAPAPVALERITNSKLGVWFYSMSTAEITNTLKGDWNDRQQIAFLYSTAVSATDLVPMYRMYQAATGDHLYTCNTSEFSSALGLGYVSEGVAGYAYGPNDARGFPLYNLVTARGIHFYTTNRAELSLIMSVNGGHEDPIRCRAVPYVTNGNKW